MLRAPTKSRSFWSTGSSQSTKHTPQEWLTFQPYLLLDSFCWIQLLKGCISMTAIISAVHGTVFHYSLPFGSILSRLLTLLISRLISISFIRLSSLLSGYPASSLVDCDDYKDFSIYSACPTGMITVSDNQWQGLTIRESYVKLRWPQATFPLTSYGFDQVDKGPHRRPTKPTLGGQLAQALALRAALVPDPAERGRAKRMFHAFLQTCKDAVKPSLVAEAWALNKAAAAL